MTRDPFEAPDDTWAAPDPADRRDDEVQDEVVEMFTAEIDAATNSVRRALARHFYRPELSTLLKFGHPNGAAACEIRIAQIVSASRHASGYRRQRRRMGYRFFPSRKKVAERWTFTGGRILIPLRCDECGAPFNTCEHPPF